MAIYYHGTNKEITEINTFYSHFDDFLFFSTSLQTAESHGEIVYKIDIDDKEIEENCRSWFYFSENEVCLNELLKEELEEIQRILNCDEEMAQEFLSERQADVSDYVEMEDTAEIGWYIQCLTARAAKKLGFRGVAIRDEHGTTYMIAMQNKEHELIKL